MPASGDARAGRRAGGGGRRPRRPRTTARLRELLLAALRRGRAELRKPARAPRTRPVTVAWPRRRAAARRRRPDAAGSASTPAVDERAWLLVAATVGALVELAEARPPADAADLALQAGRLDGHLVLAWPPRPAPPAVDALDELVPLALDEHADAIDRLQAPCARRPDGPARRRAGGCRRRSARPPAAHRRGGRAPGRPSRPSRVGRGPRRGCARAHRPRGRRAGRARTRTRTRRVASPGGSSSASTGWASGAGTTPTSPISRAASPATIARSRRPSANGCWPPGCSPRSRRWASATCSSIPRRAADIHRLIESVRHRRARPP